MPTSSLHSLAAHLPRLLLRRGFPWFVVKNAAGLRDGTGVTPAGPVGIREELTPTLWAPNKGMGRPLNATLCHTHQSSPLGMLGGLVSAPFLCGFGGDGGTAVGEGSSFPVGQ